MKIYLPDQAGKQHTIYVKPQLPECPSDWLDEANEVRMFAVKFDNGMAEVEKKLGEYLIAEGMAYRSRLIRVPNRIIQTIAGGRRA